MPDHSPSSCTRDSSPATSPVVASTTHNRRAQGRNTRTQRLPPTACMPRNAKGSPWRASRTARAPALSATMVPLDDGEHARERYHRPGRTLRQLVVDLVERLFQREEIEQRIDHARL